MHGMNLFSFILYFIKKQKLFSKIKETDICVQQLWVCVCMLH